MNSLSLVMILLALTPFVVAVYYRKLIVNIEKSADRLLEETVDRYRNAISGLMSKIDLQNKEIENLNDNINSIADKRSDAMVAKKLPRAATNRAMEILADAMPKIALAKQFYLIHPTVQERIEASVRMTKEEILLAMPSYYKSIFEKVDMKHQLKLKPDSSKKGEYLKALDATEYKPKYRKAFSSYSERVELADKGLPASSVLNDRFVLSIRGENSSAENADNLSSEEMKKRLK